MEVVWSRKEAKAEWYKYMSAVIRDRKKWLKENNQTIKQKDEIHIELTLV